MDPAHLHDIIIIGAGPCGLAVAARLREQTPSALFTDDEHERFHWIRKYRARQASRKKSSLATAATCATRHHAHDLSMLVLDSTSNNWMARWNSLFSLLEIEHLRSPMFFHVDPSDRDALRSFAHANMADPSDLREIPGCVGKELSKHQLKKRLKKQHVGSSNAEVLVNERDRRDYFTPSQRIFSAQCDCIIDRYELQKGLVQQATVLDVTYGYVDDLSEQSKIFTVTTDRGVHYARAVVMGIGAGNSPSIPSQGRPQPQACHAMQIKSFPPPCLADKIRGSQPTSILIVGGGLTSAQLADLAVRRGVKTVWLLMRGHCKVKPFDVDLEWMGKFRNAKQAAFWNAESDEERVRQIRTARGGGSITPTFHKILKEHVAAGRVRLLTHTSILQTRFDCETRQWTVKTDNLAYHQVSHIDFIYYATGVQTDVTGLPFLRSMQTHYPIHTHGGLPCLTDDLAWSEEVPLFFNGRLAGLRLGPAAGNLGGALVGAERIAWRLEELLCGQGRESDDARVQLAKGLGNQFDHLDVDCEM